VSGVLVAAVVIGIPLFLFALWPLLSRRGPKFSADRCVSPGIVAPTPAAN
jgi:hypothetical protein